MQFWGILGVIALGAVLISQFAWVLCAFGLFLVASGIRMWWAADHTPDIARNPLLAWLRRHLRVNDGLRGNAFVVREPDIVYTSNIFAALGLLALYFALAAMIHRVHYLKHALALVPVFIGSKIFLVNLAGKFPPALSPAAPAAAGTARCPGP